MAAFVFRWDPCGIISILMTYGAICYADYVLVWQLIIPTMSETLWGAANVVAFNTIVFLMVCAHLRVVFSDPGIVPLPEVYVDFSDMHSAAAVHKPSARDSLDQRQNDNGEWTVCAKCEMYRPPRAHHCRICRRCIRKMDHHCPWVNNCVGEFNQKYFLQFLFYVGMAALYALILLAISWFALDCKDCRSYRNRHIEHQRIVHSVVLAVESILFGVFVIAIISDQLQSIFYDETAVEHAQQRGRHRPLKSRMALLTEVFGTGSKWFWLCPCQSPPRPSIQGRLASRPDSSLGHPYQV